MQIFLVTGIKVLRSMTQVQPKIRTRYGVTYTGCLIIWTSKLQTQVSISTTEAKYISLSQVLREVIPVINFFNWNEKKLLPWAQNLTSTARHSRTILVPSNSLRLQKRDRVRNTLILCTITLGSMYAKEVSKIFPIDTTNQLADIFTKPLLRGLFVKFRKQIMGW